jgi:hypothetical protein
MNDSMRRAAAILLVILGGVALWWAESGAPASASAHDAMVATMAAARERAAANDARLKPASRFEEGGWIYVHLEGDPGAMGYQHGYLLAPEIEDAFAAVSAGMMRSTKRDWEFFRKAAREMLWPKIDAEYQQELQGIVEGLHARTGSKLDVDDIVAFNAFEELPDYYVPWLNKQQKTAKAPNLKSPGNCSAFVATGSWTKDGLIVMAHNNWTSYRNGERWRIVFDIAPKNGYRILMDGFPGVIASDDDFGINSDGLMVTETTITQFEGWDPNGKAEFVRARKALQYAGSIDEYPKIMLDGNNGGYANDWLLGDRKTGEIAQLELGLKAHKLWRTKDGVLSGSNWARDPKVLKEDTPQFDPANKESSPNARRARWDKLLKENKGKIDVALAEKMLADHADTAQHKEEANERTLCGHVDASPRGVKEWDWQPYYPGGAVQGKVTDATMAKEMRMMARMGRPCGGDFLVKPFLAAHPEYAWQEPYLRDMKAGPWTEFRSGQAPKE